jgi:hypothetical protein
VYNLRSHFSAHFRTPHRRVDSVEEIMTKLVQLPEIRRAYLAGMLGDLGDLEKVLVRGERLPSWEEVGLARLDLTVVVGAVGSFAKIARAGRGTVVEKSEGRLMVEGAFETVTTVGRAGRRIAPLALVYVAVTRPELIASIGGWIAEQLAALSLVATLRCWRCQMLRPPASTPPSRATLFGAVTAELLRNRPCRLAKVASPIGQNRPNALQQTVCSAPRVAEVGWKN